MPDNPTAPAEPGVSPLASQGLWGANLILFQTLGSTNRWALDHAASLQHGDIVRAVEQTAGRGRFDRTWAAPGAGNLTFSCLLRFGEDHAVIEPLVGMAAAVAVAQMLDTLSAGATLKWPNDVLVRGRKLAGILAEKDAKSGFVALGIGLNVAMSEADFAAIPLLHPATSLAIELRQTFNPDELLGRLRAPLESCLGRLTREGTSFLMPAWERRDALAGKRVSIQTPTEEIPGAYLGLNADGQCRIRRDNGRVESFWAGDVSCRLL